jgi:hypothetical protein
MSAAAPSLLCKRSPRADRQWDGTVGEAMAESGKLRDEGQLHVVSPAADATAHARWKALVLTDPVARLVRNAVHAGFDDQVYDLRQLALAAIDVVVASMGFAREAALDEVIDTLASIAARMRPGEEHGGEWRGVAQYVVLGLLNEAREQRQFTYLFADLTDPGVARWTEYQFRLLSLRDTEHGTVLVASDQAVLLYLDGLDVDIEDAEAALAHVLQRQLDDRRFDAAVRTASQAERTSVGMSAMLTDLLDATNRDVGSHDWLVDVPDRLARARRHVEGRIGEDDRFFEHVQAGFDTEASAEVRAASGQIVDLLRRAKRVHLDLERRLVGARQVFLAAQVRQRLARRRRLRLLSVGSELFSPLLALPVGQAGQVTTAFADAALGVTVPRLVRFDSVIDMLWAPPRLREAAENVPEDAGDDPGPDDFQRYPDAVLHAARDVLAGTQVAPARLSDLLIAAAAVYPDAVEGAVDDVVELVLLSALWAFDPDAVDAEETTGEVDLLASGLEAIDDGARLDQAGVHGADLLVTAKIASQRSPRPDAALTTEGSLL